MIDAVTRKAPTTFAREAFDNAVDVYKIELSRKQYDEICLNKIHCLRRCEKLCRLLSLHTIVLLKQ